MDAAITLAVRVLSAGLVFGLQILLAQLLPPEGYGGFVTLWTWMLALGSFAALGFAESSVRFIPRYHARGRLNTLGDYWRFGLISVALGSVALAAVGIGAAAVIGWQSGLGLTVLLIALGLPFLAIEYYLEGVARSFGWFQLATVPVYILRPILIGGACLILVQLGQPLSLPAIGAILIGSMAAVVCGVAAVLRYRIGKIARVERRPPAGQRRLWLVSSLPLLLISGLEDLTSYADVLVLSLLAEPDSVGVYFAASRSLALAGFVAYAMTLVSGRRFALDLVAADRRELQRSVLESTRLTLWATIVAVALGLAAGPFLLGAFGPEFVAGYVVMFILGAGMIVRAMSGQAAEALIVLGRQKESVLVGAGVLVMTGLLAFLLVPPFGIAGAAWASVAAMVGRTLALAWVLWRTERLRVIDLRLPRLSRG